MSKAFLAQVTRESENVKQNYNYFGPRLTSGERNTSLWAGINKIIIYVHVPIVKPTFHSSRSSKRNRLLSLLIMHIYSDEAALRI